MLEVTLSGVNGRQWDLTGTPSTSQVLAPMSALTGLVGVASRMDMPRPGRAGVAPGDLQFGALETQVDFYLHADDGEEMERLYVEFRQSWRLWSKIKRPPPTVIKAQADHPLGPFFLDLWLSQPLPGVPVDMRRRTSTTVTANVFNPTGLARSMPISGTGEVTLLNSGDEVVYPQLTYKGAGGVVTSPSGATFTLPPSDERTTINLDPQHLHLDGAFPEGVPPGESGTWVLPEGVTASWEIRVADPWA